ncbi:hypothetical protein HYT57_01720 [Candidatus Woesearchaeota archaeon]|nr:hypothetical protein [Candidatus Woesearchaeota archaeon]
MKTSIAGSAQKEELYGNINDLKERFPKKIDGFFNSKLGSFELDFIANNEGYISVHDTFVGDWHNHIPMDQWKSFEKELRRSWRNEFRFGHDIAFLFPHHDFAFIIDSGRFEYIPKGIEVLKDLGYVPVVKRRDKYSTQWGLENQLELLSHLRSPDLVEVKAADTRAKAIVNEVLSNLPLEPEHITFAVYSPKRKKGKPYNPELVINPVKKLIKVPFIWRDETLESVSKGLNLERAVGLTSLVETNSGIKHIPMLDFTCRDIGFVHLTLEELGMTGVVVASGNSYHFYGSSLLDEIEWKDYMEELERDWWEHYSVDNNWVKLQLVQGYSMLRITPAKRKLHQPCLIEKYEPKQVSGKDDSLAKRVEYRQTG